MRQYKDTLQDGDFTGNSLIENEFVSIATRQSTRKQWYAFGGEARQNAGNFYFDPHDGTQDITGEVRVVVYETDRMDEIKAIGDAFDIGTIRSANADDRQTWETLPVQADGAETDEVLALEVRVDNSNNAGNTVDLSSTDYKVPLQRYRQ